MYKFIGKKNRCYELDIKFNTNCPESEKGGKTGPGSCSGGVKSITKPGKFIGAGTSNILTVPLENHLHSNYSLLRKNYMENKQNISKFDKELDNIVKSNNKKVDEYLRTNGYNPESDIDMQRAIDDMETSKILKDGMDKIDSENDKSLIRIEKQREYYKLQENKLYSEMIKSYSSENKLDSFDATQNTHGNKLTNISVNKFTDITIGIDKNSIIEPNELYFNVKKMPKQLSDSIKRIDVLQYKNPDDEHWSKILNEMDFNSAGCAGNGKISFFMRNEIPNEVLIHESAHLFDDKSRYSESPEWKNAMIEDVGKFQGPKYVSRYAEEMGMNVEDFAESVSLYLTSNAEFKYRFPSRAKILNRLLQV